MVRVCRSGVWIRSGVHAVMRRCSLRGAGAASAPLRADTLSLSRSPALPLPPLQVILARHCGLNVCAVSIVVNYAAGMTEQHITHEETLHYTKEAAGQVRAVRRGSSGGLGGREQCG